MKHKRNTKNTLSVRLFTMLLTCSLLLAGIPTFALAETEPVYIDFSSADDVTLENGAAVDESYGTILTLPAEGASVKLILPVKTNTNYTLSFEMKNSLADALRMNKTDNAFHYRGYKDRTMETINDENGKPWGEKLSYFIKGGSFSYLIPKDHTFGIEREGNAITWRSISFNFTTPKQKVEESYVTIKFIADKEDAELAIKDLCLEAKGNGVNRIFNGDFEAFDESKDTRVPTSFEPNNSANVVTWEVVKENENHYLKIVPKSGKSVGAVQAGAFLAKIDESLPNSGTRFKFSMKYKADNTKSPVLRFYGDGEGLGSFTHVSFPSAEKNTWETYTLYLDGSRYLAGRDQNNDRYTWVKNLWFGYRDWEHYIDDLYYGLDTTGIDFYKQLDFFYADEAKTDRYITHSTGSAENGTDEIVMTEKSIPALGLEDITPDENGYRLVTPRLHYIPTANADGTYDAQITFIAAVYRMEGDKKVLYSMDIADGETTEDGKTIDIKIDNVKVPQEEGYYIEAMAWDGTNTMKPIAGVNKTIFD